jgi:hypothetical protein
MASSLSGNEIAVGAFNGPSVATNQGLVYIAN